MAKASLEIPFMGIRGRLDHSSETYYCTRLGENVVSHYPKHKDPKKITARQKARYAVFQQAVAQADQQLKDPQMAAGWQTKFNKQKQTAKKPYRLLRNYVIATLTKQMEQNQQ
jgi:hypothetical protein